LLLISTTVTLLVDDAFHLVFQTFIDHIMLFRHGHFTVSHGLYYRHQLPVLINMALLYAANTNFRQTLSFVVIIYLLL